MAKQTPEREQWATKSDEHRTDFAKPPSAKGPAAAAWALWIVGFALECLGVVALAGWPHIPGLSDVPAATLAVALVADLVVVLLATSFYKRAQARRSKKGQGVVPAVMATVAFVPMVLFFVTSKNAGPRLRVAATVAAVATVAALVGGGVALGQMG